MLKRQVIADENEDGSLDVRGFYKPRTKKYYGRYILLYGDQYAKDYGGYLTPGKVHILMEMKSDNSLIPSTELLLKISKKYGIAFSTLVDDRAGLRENMIITRISTGVYMVNPFLFTMGRQEGLEEKKTYWNRLVAQNNHNKSTKKKKEKRKSVLEQKKVVDVANGILSKASEE